ncbi:hypothetical protein HS125_10045 [bacterium]|nr:hypothetical protein [bacterium]
MLEQFRSGGGRSGRDSDREGIVNSEQLRAVAEEQQRRHVSRSQALANLGLVSSSNIHNTSRTS